MCEDDEVIRIWSNEPIGHLHKGEYVALPPAFMKKCDEIIEKLNNNGTGEAK